MPGGASSPGVTPRSRAGLVCLAKLKFCRLVLPLLCRTPVLDPETRQVYTATAAEGLREVKTGVLRTESPAIEMPLTAFF